jgi:hypothetical protein
LLTAFDGNVLFELPPMLLTMHKPSQMQGMEKSMMAMLGAK